GRIWLAGKLDYLNRQQSILAKLTGRDSCICNRAVINPHIPQDHAQIKDQSQFSSDRSFVSGSPDDGDRDNLDLFQGVPIKNTPMSIAIPIRSGSAHSSALGTHIGPIKLDPLSGYLDTNRS
ncbi:MAG TPA: hypothetical protein VHS05_30110, partial [Pyrinomonadaceae bacterium]|nr:hypothetical protein [Pyrinomonadaceae bacterium]